MCLCGRAGAMRRGCARRVQTPRWRKSKAQVRRLLLTGLAAVAAVWCGSAAEVRTYLDAVVAVVNDAVITGHDVNLELEAFLRNAPTRLTAEQRREKAERIQKELVDREVLYAEFGEMGYTVPSEAVEREVDRYVLRSAGGSRAKFEEELRGQGVTWAELQEKLTKSLAIELFVRERIKRPVTVSPTAVTDHYEQNRQQYSVPERWHVQAIFLNKKGHSARELSQIHATVVKRLAADEGFAAIASELSEDAYTAKRGGELGWLESPTADDQHLKAVRCLEPGSVSPLSEFIDPMGERTLAVIYRLVEVQKGRVRPLDGELRAEIERALRREEENERYATLVSKLRRKFFVKVYPMFPF